MSCLKPLHIYNPSKLIDMSGGQPYRIMVPCGKCVECKSALSNAYYFRSFYEAMYTLDSGGYILFDTLTYRDSSLPRISNYVEAVPSMFDFPCFSYRDIRLFLVLLRRKISKLGYDSSKLKYFISCEYGTDPERTHRPHYHTLFYVTCGIDPLVFSRLISDSWPHGRTDGLPYQTTTYVKRHIYTNETDVTAVQKACTYVSKYVQKSSKFDLELFKRVSRILLYKYNFDDTYLQSEEAKEERRKLIRLCGQFHRQSHGFGASFLKYNNIDDIYNTGMIRLTDFKGIARQIPIPMYYKRVLFYDLVKDFRNERVWRLNDYGRNYMKARALDSVKHLATRFKDWYYNLESYTNKAYEIRVNVDNLLGVRSWLDFAIYIALYKGRVYERKDIINSDVVQDYEISVYDWLDRMYKEPDLTLSLFNYVTPSDKEKFGLKFIANDFYGSSDLIPDNFVDSPVMLPWQFAEFFVINQLSAPQFSGFDDLYNLYCDSLIDFNNSKQSAFDLISDIRERLKVAFK